MLKPYEVAWTDSGLQWWDCSHTSFLLWLWMQMISKHTSVLVQLLLGALHVLWPLGAHWLLSIGADQSPCFQTVIEPSWRPLPPLYLPRFSSRGKEGMRSHDLEPLELSITVRHFSLLSSLEISLHMQCTTKGECDHAVAPSLHLLQLEVKIWPHNLIREELSLTEKCWTT